MKQVPLAVPFARPALLCASAQTSDTAVLKVAMASPCGDYLWHERGQAPKGFIQGMALAYSKAYCALKQGSTSAASFIGSRAPQGNIDALSIYGIVANSPVERLRATYTLALGEGMRESAGNPTAGYDTTVKHQTSNTAEAGLFQVSHDSLGLSPRLGKIYRRYNADRSSCLAGVFMQGAEDKGIGTVGSGEEASFQQLTKACPAFAVEYAAVLMRLNARHFGPIIRHEAEYVAACATMLKQVEDVSTKLCP